MPELIVFVCIVLLSICLTGSLILIGLIIIHCKWKKYKYIKIDILLLITMMLSIGLLKIHHLIPKFEDSTVSYYIINSQQSDGEEKFIKLPPGSKWLFKTPTDIFTCDLNSKDCKMFFGKELEMMKENGIIEDFIFHDDQSYFSVKKYNKEIATIDIIDDGDARRFGILYN